MQKAPELIQSLFTPLDRAHFEKAQRETPGFRLQPYPVETQYLNSVYGWENVIRPFAEKIEAALSDYLSGKIDSKTYLQRVGEYTETCSESGEFYWLNYGEKSKDHIRIHTLPLLLKLIPAWLEQNAGMEAVEAADKLLGLINAVIPNALAQTLKAVLRVKLPESRATFQTKMVDQLLTKDRGSATIQDALADAATGNLHLVQHLVKKGNVTAGNITSGMVLANAAHSDQQVLISYLLGLISGEARVEYLLRTALGSTLNHHKASFHLLERVLKRARGERAENARDFLHTQRPGQHLVNRDDDKTIALLIQHGCVFSDYVKMLHQAVERGKAKALHALLAHYGQHQKNIAAHNEEQLLSGTRSHTLRSVLDSLFHEARNNFYILEVLEQYSGRQQNRIAGRPEYSTYLQNKKYYLDSGDSLPGQVAYILHKDMRGINPHLFRKVQRMLASEGYPATGSMNQTLARRACLFFKKEAFLAQALKNHGQPGRAPLHNLLQKLACPEALILPNADAGLEKTRATTFQAWRDACIQAGSEMMKIMVFCLEPGLENPILPERNEQGHWSAELTKQKITKQIFSENPEVADLALRVGAPLSVIVEAQKILREWKKKPPPKSTPKTYLPDLKIDGKDFGRPNLRLRKLQLDDPRALFIGAFTECCQRLDQQGHESLRHMYETGASCLYVLEDKKTGEIKGHSWAWRGTQGELCFDNVEWKGRVLSLKTWKDIFSMIPAMVRADKKAAGITRIMLGKSINMPDHGGRKENNKPAEPIKFKGYRESHTQYQIG